MKLSTIRGILFAVLLAAFYYAPGQTDSIRFLPHWSHQAQFAGYYMALEKEFYHEAGFHVDILCGGPANPVSGAYGNENVHFYSNFLAGSLKAYDQGHEIVNLAQLSKKSALIFVVRDNHGMIHPKELDGKRIGIWESDFREIPEVFLKMHGVHGQFIPVKSTVNLFLMGGLDAMCVMWYNEYHQLINSGINEDELTGFFLTDYGLDIPEDGIYCSRKFYTDNKDLCNRFVDATVAGWFYAFENIEETLDVTMEYMHRSNIPANRSQQEWMLRRMKDLMLPDTAHGFSIALDREKFDKCVNLLITNKTISRYPAFDEFLAGGEGK